MSRVVIFSMLPWRSTLLHRHHMLARAFRELGREVVYVEKRNTWNPLRWGTCALETDESGIEILAVYGLPYCKGYVKNVFRWNDRFIEKALSERFDGQGAFALIGTPHWAQAVSRSPAFKDRICYDISDDYGAFATHGGWKEILDRYEKKAVEASQTVFATSEVLMEKASGKGVLVENGVDLKRFKNARRKNLEARGRIIGFIGGLYEWVDFDLIEKVAERFREDTVVLVGPTDRKERVERLAERKNLLYLGAVPWEEIHHYFKSFDVGMIPFVSEAAYPRLKTVDSNKVYQYLYFGYPVVSTAYGQVEKMREWIHVAEDHGAFLDLLEPTVPARRGRPLDIKAFSWESRAKRMLMYLEGRI